ncbi:MFS transporter [Aquicoccus sp. G2-2]|uniref:MFS transporter n=1 Tax=Aquicoccus sp. G2-2 TaxID=3092120 RepID=UPI002AE06C93|nr:MFS transporter [Aquicoccus sp. G2-2]MEA1115006.1 MFS transporter [Aquicoccus sp. G2-2]
MSGLSALSNPRFRIYYLGAIAGVNGNWIFRVLLSWLAWDVTHDPSFVGLIAASSLAPVALTTPFFGALADRMDILKAYRIVLFGMLVAPSSLLLLMYSGHLAALPLLGIAITFGVMLSAYQPVRQSLGPRLVDPPEISSVIALGSLNFNVGRLLSPAIGGVLIGEYGTMTAAIVSISLFLPALVIAPLLRPRERALKIAPTSYLTDLREGIRVGWQEIPVRRSLLLTVLALGPVRAVTEILALIADGSFERGATGLGLLTSGVGAGALLAALFLVAAGPRLARMRTLRYGIIAMGFAATIALSLAPTFPLAIAAAIPMGFTGTYVGVSLQIGMQARLADELRGRIMSLWLLSVTLSTSALSLTISALSEWAGIGGAVTTVIVIAAVLVTFVVLRFSRA